MFYNCLRVWPLSNCVIFYASITCIALMDIILTYHHCYVINNGPVCSVTYKASLSECHQGYQSRSLNTVSTSLAIQIYLLL